MSKNLSTQCLRMKVRRKQAWKDVKLKLSRCNTSQLQQQIKVQFVGEPAVDEGGPRRELFCIVDRLVSTILMTGPDGKKTFAHNLIALQNREFFIYGQFVAMSLLQGSSGPKCFLRSVTDYILYKDFAKITPTVDEIPDHSVRNALIDLLNIEDSATFDEEASFNFSLRFQAGYTKPLVSKIDTEELTRCMALHYTVLFCQAELDQFLEGLALNGVLDALRQHPSQSRKVLENHHDILTAEVVDDLFHTEYSVQGNIKREKEEAISFNFSNFLEEVESGKICHDEGTPMTLGDVLAFITGATNVPVIGFDQQPTITFDFNAPEGWKLTSNTCSNTIHFPVNSVLLEYESFKEEVTFCIRNSQGFGCL